MTDPVISREQVRGGGRYALHHADGEAELTYTVTSPTLIIAGHTGVPDALRGTGAGLALVARMVADARAEGVKVVPACPFIDAMRRRHPEWADVFAV